MAEQDFVGSISTNEIWRDNDTTRCLTDDLDSIEASIDDVETSVSDIVSSTTTTNKTMITSFSDGWTTYYTTENASAYPTVYRFGNVVTLTGVLKNTAAVALEGGSTHVFTIPAEYAPSQNMYQVCNGSGMNKYLVAVWPEGKVNFSRYGITSYQSVAAGSWFPFTLTWVIE